MNKFLNPDEIIDELDISPSAIIADFGCGSGGFTVPLAKTASEGLVYGLDIMEAPLSALKGRLMLENITNVKLIKCDLEAHRGASLPAEAVDMVVIPNVLFQSDNKNGIILEALRILKRGGKLVIIDWLTKASQGPEEGRIAKEEVIKLAKEQGATLLKEFNAGKYHYGIILIK